MLLFFIFFYLLFFYLLLFILVLVSCKNVDDTAANEEHPSIEVADYFPPVNLERIYIKYGDKGEEYYSQQVVGKEKDEDGTSNDLY